MKPLLTLSLLLTLLMSNCIGTDYLDDPIVDERIELNTSSEDLLVGETVVLSAIYFNQYGLEEEVSLVWTSSDEAIVTVDANGLVAAVSGGQAEIRASYDGTESDPVTIVVVADLMTVSSVTIAEVTSQTIAIGEAIQFSASSFNINGDPLSGDVNWNSSNTMIISIDQNGLALALANGSSDITAIIDGVSSNPVTITVGSLSKMGTFQGASGYKAVGTAILEPNDEDELILTLSDNFDTDFALGTFVYLSNNTGGATTRSSGLELAEITSDGGRTFNITSIDSSVDINTYQYVVILCKPASITFGFAELN